MHCFETSCGTTVSFSLWSSKDLAGWHLQPKDLAPLYALPEHILEIQKRLKKKQPPAAQHSLQDTKINYVAQRQQPTNEVEIFRWSDLHMILIEDTLHFVM